LVQARQGSIRTRHDRTVARLVERHGDALLATARRYTLTREDAEDAYQRALEILLTKAPPVGEEELVRWTKTVIKHEAFAIWRSRERTVPASIEQPLEGTASAAPPADDRVQSYERLRLGAEALRRLKPQEIRCLVLRAEGYSYRQICELTGWTYTKVNRCLTEGRRSFLRRVAGIESGAECDRLSPLLSALADGEATSTELATLRPHLRSCLACRAALRAFRELPHRAAEVVPVAAAGGSDRAPATIWDWAESVADWGQSAAGWAQERAALIGAKLQSAVETQAAGKVAAVAASSAALAGGSVAMRSLEGDPGSPAHAGVGESEPLLERMVPVSPPRPEPPTEPEIVLPPAPPAPEPVEATLPPPPLPPSYIPPPDRAEEFPDRVTTPVTNPGQSALPAASEEQRPRQIEPMTEPAQPPEGRSIEETFTSGEDPASAEK
jgi:RNA polymerase sigma factor (sigma-70 family)